MWVKWFEYSTLKTMDEDLAEEACILRRLWPGSIEKEKQRMNVEKEEKKKKCKVKLNRMRSNNHHQKDQKNMTGKLRRFQTYASVWDDSSNKLRTRIDRIGAKNPIWNNKFVSRLLRSSYSAKLLAFPSRSVLLVTCAII
ncbi:unnamed protein product [Brassica oleracea var. botrytis]